MYYHYSNIVLASQCWASVAGDAPVLHQHSAHGSCLFSRHTNILIYVSSNHDIIMNIFFLTLLITHFQDRASHQKVLSTLSGSLLATLSIIALCVRIRLQSC